MERATTDLTPEQPRSDSPTDVSGGRGGMEGATSDSTPELPRSDPPADVSGGQGGEECLGAAGGSGICPICHRRVFSSADTVGAEETEGVRHGEVPATVGDVEATFDQGHTTERGTRFDLVLDDKTDDGTIDLLFPNREQGRLGQWGPYEIQRELGRGGMGIVFKGFDFVLRRIVAIKVMNPALATGARSRARFVRESRAMAAISHPNIVAIHAVDEHRGIPYLVMEFVAGEGLDERIRRLGSLPVAEVLRVGAQIADGLEAAHAQATIHRDIKPGNILLGPGDRVKISDFGLALVVLENSDLTPAEHLLGTPSYMAPEQIGGRGTDTRADLYSLGCVIHAMATGRPPFGGKNVVDIARRVCDETPRRIDEINPDIPRPLADLVRKLLEKDPNARVQTAAEIAAALRGMLGGRELEALSSALPASRRGKRTTRRRPRRLRVWAVGGLLGAMAMLLASWRLPWPRPWPSTFGLLSQSAVVGPESSTIVAPEPPSAAVDTEPSPADPDRWSPPVVADPSSLPLPDPSTTPMRLVVSVNSPAHFTSLTKAIAYATPGSTINVMEGEYQGPILIHDSDRLRGLTIEADMGAVVKGPLGEDVSVMDITDTPNVVIRGLTIRSSTILQHGLRLLDDVSGVLLERVRLEQVEGGKAAIIHVAPGAHGTPEAPARLRNLDVDVRGLGIVLGSSNKSQTVSNIHIENCWIHGPGDGTGSPLVLETSVRDTVISGNIIEGGDNGISMALTDFQKPARLEVRNNTVRKCKSWINLGYTDGRLTGVDITRNLVVDCELVTTRIPDLEIVGPIWFRENVWWTRDADNVGLVARKVDPAQLLSTDPRSPDYLRPADPASVTVKDEATGKPVFAGAVDPQPDSSNEEVQGPPVCRRDRIVWRFPLSARRGAPLNVSNLRPIVSR